MISLRKPSPWLGRTAGLLLAVLAAATHGTAAEDRPNIVLIMADDLGYGDISPYDGWIETPNLDRLAAEGLRFTDFHTSGNVCSPTRAGLLTGRYQQRAGLPGVLFANSARPEHRHGLRDVEHTFAEGLRDAGYATAMFGKWHLGYLPKFNPVRHGFGRFRGFVSGNIDYVSHIDTTGRADWWIDDQLREEKGYFTELITEHAVRFIGENKAHPFLLYLAHHAPHYPFQGPSDPAERTVDGEFDPVGARPDKREAYREMVQSMDHGIGQVAAALEEHGIRERTLIWFFSDNGAASRWGSNEPLRGSKGTDWEGGHRVPAIASWPGQIGTGAVTSALTSTLDVMPTILKLADVPPNAEKPYDGIDLSPVLLDGEPLPPRQLFWGGDGVFWNGAAVRDGPWKLVIDRYEGESPERPMLFNLDADLGESNDLATTHHNRAKQMYAALLRWRDDVASGATPQ